MNDNLKEFLRKASADDALFAEMQSLEGEADKKATVARAIELAKGVGIELTDADFEVPESELDAKELEAVAGGWTECACVVGGGGSKDEDGKTCVCILGGQGDAQGSGGRRCLCVNAGWGYDAWASR